MISDLGRRGMVLSVKRKHKGADQLHGYREADLLLCFRICKKPVSHDAAHILNMFDKFYSSRTTFRLFKGKSSCHLVLWLS